MELCTNLVGTNDALGLVPPMSGVVKCPILGILDITL